MATSKYIRMLSGRDRGQVLDVEFDAANYLIAQGQAEEVDFNNPRALETSTVPITDVLEVRTISAAGQEVIIPPAAMEINTPRLKRKK